MTPITDFGQFLGWLYAVAKDNEEIEVVKAYIDTLFREIHDLQRQLQENAK